MFTFTDDVYCIREPGKSVQRLPIRWQLRSSVIELAPVQSRTAISKPVNPFDELDRLFERMQQNVEEAVQWWEQESFESEGGPGTVQIDHEDVLA